MTAARRPTRPRRRPAAAPLELIDRCRPRTPLSFLRRVVRETLRFARRPRLRVSLLVTGDTEIADLHARFLGDPTPTDVICFPSDDGAEVVVSRDTAKRIAREQGHTLRAELALYVVHGILHAAGFDDVKPRDRVRMRAAEREVMRRLRLDVRPVDA